jgi:dTDP-4-amino-4,6-dideoxygalactose transaminase
MSQAGVPLLDLTAQYATIREEILPVLERVCASQQFILGPEVEGLERELAEYCNTRHALGVSSGSDAILLALQALDVGSGDEVLLPSYTFFATAGAVARLGAVPVFVDIDRATYNMDPQRLEQKITPKTKAIIAVHLYGQCAPMDAIVAVAERHGVPVIEDAAQAIGAEYHGRRAGGLGRVACFSFFPSKNLGAFGDAGAITTNDTQLHERMHMLRVHGGKVRYYHDEVGGNFRIDALQAAVLRVKLRHLDRWTAGRQRNAHLYQQAFGEANLLGTAVTPPRMGPSRHVMNQFVVRCAERDRLWEHLKQNKIGAEVYYPVPLHLQRCFAGLGYGAGDFPESERAAATTLALPIFPELKPEQIYQVVDAMSTFYRGLGLTRRAAA